MRKENDNILIAVIIVIGLALGGAFFAFVGMSEDIGTQTREKAAARERREAARAPAKKTEEEARITQSVADYKSLSRGEQMGLIRDFVKVRLGEGVADDDVAAVTAVALSCMDGAVSTMPDTTANAVEVGRLFLACEDEIKKAARSEK